MRAIRLWQASLTSASIFRLDCVGFKGHQGDAKRIHKMPGRIKAAINPTAQGQESEDRANAFDTRIEACRPACNGLRCRSHLF
jgi:hypothetical protein